MEGSRSRRHRYHARFTPEEDEQLRHLVQEHGASSWPIVADARKRRTVRQCRDRWTHYLSSGGGAAPWTPEDDALLLQTIDEIGLKWVRLANFLSNRTDLEVKKRWLDIFNNRRSELLNRSSGSRAPKEAPPLDAQDDMPLWDGFETVSASSGHTTSSNGVSDRFPDEVPWVWSGNDGDADL
jgi:hypothetical protein